jgi:predicted flap endonuclease-1-like 5' DNA nuclease
MSYRVVEIEGIGDVLAGKLAAVDIRTTTDLLEKCGSAKSRKAVSSASGIDEGKLLAFVNMADLMRISGIGSEFSELLEAAGVDTVKELQHRRVDNLVSKMAEVNERKKLTRRVPNATEVAKWIEQAKTLAPMVSH